MFKEFASCTRKGFVYSVLAGGALILAFAAVSVLTGNTLFLKAGLIAGLAGSRLAEAAFSRRCPWSKACLEGSILALIGVVLVAADDYIMDLLA